MRELTRADIRSAAEYEAERDQSRQQLIEVKRNRRINLDHKLSLVFENRETLRGAVEELVRTERLTNDDQIAAEVNAFNQIVPAEGELSACLYLEVSDPAHLTDTAEHLRGIGEAISLRVARDEIQPTGQLVDVEVEPPLVYHLRFHLSAAQRERWKQGAEVVVRVDHPACSTETTLTEDQRQALAEDLR